MISWKEQTADTWDPQVTQPAATSTRPVHLEQPEIERRLIRFVLYKQKKRK